MFKLNLEKAAEQEIKLPISVESLKKQENSRKTSTFASLTTPKPFTVWITTNCGKFFKRWEYQTTLPVSWEICMRVKKQQLELDMEQRTGSKLGKEYIKAVYCHPAYLTYTQSEKWKSLSHVQLSVISWTVAYQAPPSMWFSGKSTGVGCHFLLQGIFLMQGWNPGLPNCRQTLYHLGHHGSPYYL